MKRVFAWSGGVMGLCAALAGLWTGLDYLGVRPVLSRELVAVQADLEIVANGVNYIRWQELDRKAQAGTLGPRERVEYCQLSAQLGIRGIGCA